MGGQVSRNTISSIVERFPPGHFRDVCLIKMQELRVHYSPPKLTYDRCSNNILSYKSRHHTAHPQIDWCLLLFTWDLLLLLLTGAKGFLKLLDLGCPTRWPWKATQLASFSPWDKFMLCHRRKFVSSLYVLLMYPSCNRGHVGQSTFGSLSTIEGIRRVIRFYYSRKWRAIQWIPLSKDIARQRLSLCQGWKEDIEESMEVYYFEVWGWMQLGDLLPD